MKTQARSGVSIQGSVTSRIGICVCVGKNGEFCGGVKDTTMKSCQVQYIDKLSILGRKVENTNLNNNTRRRKPTDCHIRLGLDLTLPVKHLALGRVVFQLRRRGGYRPDLALANSRVAP